MRADFTTQVAALPLTTRHRIAKRAADAKRVSGSVMLVRSARMYRRGPDRSSALADLCVALLVMANDPALRRRSAVLRRLEILCTRAG